MGVFCISFYFMVPFEFAVAFRGRGYEERVLVQVCGGIFTFINGLWNHGPFPKNFGFEGYAVA